MKKILYSDIKNILKKNSVNIHSDIDNNEFFDSLGSLDSSLKNHLTFFHNNKYQNFLCNTNAKACFIKDIDSKYLNKSCIPLIVTDPYIAYALTSHLIESKIISNGNIDSSSNIYKQTILGKNVQINSNVIIKENCTIGDNTIIFENSVIGPDVQIGDNSIIMNNSTILHTHIGNECLIQSGTVIGGKGFGFTSKEKVEIRHIGKVIISNNVDIGSNTTIDRGTIESTSIDSDVRIDNLVQIAHNVKIGNNTIIASQVGIAGSTKIGNNCSIGGQAGISGHLNIGNNVKIAAKSGVTKNISDNSVVAGFPAQDIMKWKKSIIALRK